MKKLHFMLPLALLALGCGDKNKSQPEPEEYFSFYVDGVQYDYPQEKKDGWLGESKTLFAGPSSATVGYIISARTFTNPAADGNMIFTLSGNYIPTQDTIILNGSTNGAGISALSSMSNNYELKTPLTGKIIFSERSPNKLTGTFQFDAYKMKVVGMNQVPTDTIIQITNGKFSIIPSN